MSVSRDLTAGVGRIVLNRSDRMNAVDVALATGLRDTIIELGNDPNTRVIVIRGAGGNFCAGGDFAEVQRLTAQGAEALRELFVAFRSACDAVAGVPVPVIAAVEGVAAAGGFELMQAADIVLVSDDARIADNHVNFGMIPGGGSSARLPRLVGRQQALGLLLSGDRISGLDAVRMGLAYRSYPADEFDTAIAQFAVQLADRDRDAVITIKRLVNAGLAGTLADALDAETDSVVAHICGSAGATGVDRFKDRLKGRPKEAHT